MRRPLSDCRVLDLGIITAGAATSALLADLGAQVVKVESSAYQDPFRAWAPTATGVSGASPFFRSTNRNKLCAAINLKHRAGRDAFLRLVSQYDVVVENFRRGVLPRLGLGYDELFAVNPDIILASISSQGEDGPHAGHVSFGSTLDAMSGLAWMSGEPAEGPMLSGQDLNYPDQVVSMFAASAIAAAWRRRNQGKGGVHLDVSQRELTSYLCGEAFASDDAGRRLGNTDPDFAAQGCFRASDGVWLAVSVPFAARNAGWLEQCEPLETRLEAWIHMRGSEEACAELKSLGVFAQPVLNSAEAYRNCDDRMFAMQTLGDGSLVKGFPFQFANHPMTVDRDAPGLGAHTEEVLAEAGFSRAEIDDLRACGAIETGANDRPRATPAAAALT